MVRAPRGQVDDRVPQCRGGAGAAPGPHELVELAPDDLPPLRGSRQDRGVGGRGEHTTVREVDPHCRALGGYRGFVPQPNPGGELPQARVAHGFGGEVPGLAAPEIFPTNLRALGAGVGNGAGRLATFGTTFLVAALLTWLGFTAVFLYLAAVILLAGLTIGLFGERTRGRSLEEITRVGPRPDATAEPETRTSPSRRPPRDRDDAADQAVALFRLMGAPGQELDESWLRSIAAAAYDVDADRLAGQRQLSACKASGDRRAELGRIEVPTLVVHGDRDPMQAPTAGRATAAAIPGARLLIVPGAGHVFPTDAWPCVLDAVSPGLSSRSAG